MQSILMSMWCIPCIWTVLSLLGTFAVTNYIRNLWVPFRGPLPSDGPVEGFASKAARIEFYDTTPLRVRTATKFGIIGVAVWMIGGVIAYTLLKTFGG